MLRLLLFLLLLPLPAQALTEYRGESSLYQDTVWEGEVRIDGILTVAMGVTLEIRPGTQIRFVRYDSNGDQVGESELFIQGRLLARGTSEQPILFSSAEANPRPGDWGAVNMMMSEEQPNILEYCRVEYGYRGFHSHFARAELRHSVFRNNLRGAQFQESKVRIDDCDFSQNFNGVQFRDSTVELRNSRIESNNWGLRAVYVDLQMEGCQIRGNRINGISLRDSDCTLTGNRIAGNRRGLYLQRSRCNARDNQIASNLEHGIYLEDSLVELVRNRIVDNGRSGLKVQESGGEVLENRFAGNHQQTLVNDGEEDFVLGENSFAGEPVILDQRLRPNTGKILLSTPK